MTITTDNDCKPVDFSGIEQSLKDLVYAQISLGKEVFRLLGDGMCGLGLPKMKSCCEKPEPCWMPLSLGELKLELAANGTAEIHFEVNNRDYQSRVISVAGAGNNATLVHVSPPQATLVPMERVVFTATVTAPAQVGVYQFLIVVHGCREHCLRGVLHVGGKPKTCRCVVTVNDQCYTGGNWYDHFYCHCERPRLGPAVPTA
jgi:hypothetical protein